MTSAASDRALDLFVAHGFAATSLEDLEAAGTGRHALSKDEHLHAATKPYLDAIERVLDGFPNHPSWPDEGARLLAAYVDVLAEHRTTAGWLDRDMSVAAHPVVGRRLAECHRRLRQAIQGDNRSAAARLGAASVVGVMMRPTRYPPDPDPKREKSTILAAALAVAKIARSS